ncbi:tRNA (adenosine(37)-N6)-dimethylallyltransferase MiaA [Tumebacillus algifaecis]
MGDKPRILIIVGPTAVGKTALSLACAKALNGEILSADSMQIYKGMDIGTAKIRPEEMEGVPHFGLDLVYPDQPYTVVEFKAYADRMIRETQARGKLPIIVGGTMLYVKALIDPMDFTEAKEDPEFRQQLWQQAEEQGGDPLHKRLQEVDPITAERLHPNDVKRVIRALEVHHATGVPLSQSFTNQATEGPYDPVLVGLNLADRQELYQRINRRVDIMIEQGLVEEVKALLAAGYHRDLQSMQAIGYKEIVDFLDGRATFEEAVESVKQGSRRYAKRQLSWWRREERIHWFDGGHLNEDGAHLNESECLRKISNMLEGIS